MSVMADDVRVGASHALRAAALSDAIVERAQTLPEQRHAVKDLFPSFVGRPLALVDNSYITE
jgi:hypothetical protein